MKPSAKRSVPFALVVIPYLLLLVYYVVSYFTTSLEFLFYTGLFALLPFAAMALLLKFRWKIDYEDGTGKGDALTLFFGTFCFMGIVGGIAAWFYMLAMTNQ
jgi:hypothetical protein